MIIWAEICLCVQYTVYEQTLELVTIKYSRYWTSGHFQKRTQNKIWSSMLKTDPINVLLITSQVSFEILSFM